MATQNTVTQLDFMQVTAGDFTPTLLVFSIVTAAVAVVSYFLVRRDGEGAAGGFGLAVGVMAGVSVTMVTSIFGVLPPWHDELDRDASQAALAEQANAVYGVQLGSDGARDLLDGVYLDADEEDDIEFFGETTAITADQELVDVQLVWQIDRWALYANGTELQPLNSERWN